MKSYRDPALAGTRREEFEDGIVRAMADMAELLDLLLVDNDAAAQSPVDVERRRMMTEAVGRMNVAIAEAVEIALDVDRNSFKDQAGRIAGAN